MSNYKSFETNRLLLTPSSPKDAAFFFELLNSPKWLKNIGERDIKSIEDAKNYIKEKLLASFVNYGYGNYTVIRKIDNEKIGSCGLYNRAGLRGVDIGFAFLPDFEGQGYGFESSSRLKEAAYTDFGLKEICAITTKTNKESQKLLEKLGLEFIKYIKLPNDDEELLFYKIVLSKNDI